VLVAVDERQRTGRLRAQRLQPRALAVVVGENGANLSHRVTNQATPARPRRALPPQAAQTRNSVCVESATSTLTVGGAPRLDNRRS